MVGNVHYVVTILGADFEGGTVKLLHLAIGILVACIAAWAEEPFNTVRLGDPKDSTVAQLKSSYSVSKLEGIDMWLVASNDGIVGSILFSNGTVAAIKYTTLMMQSRDASEFIRKIYHDLRFRTDPVKNPAYERIFNERETTATIRTRKLGDTDNNVEIWIDFSNASSLHLDVIGNAVTLENVVRKPWSDVVQRR